jgi:hypothetical protein
MADIQTTYSLTYKDGLYFKKSGDAFSKPNACNLVKGQLEKGGYKVTLVPVGDKWALRILSLDKTEPVKISEVEKDEVVEQPETGSNEKSIEALRKEVADLEERKALEERLAELKGNGKEPELSRGSCPSGRPKRKPFIRNVLDFPESAGYVRRVVNDVEDGMRVRQFIEDDWEIDPDQTAKVSSDGDLNYVGEDGITVSKPSQFGTAVSRHVGTDAQGKSIKGVLLRKRKDWYDEDQMEKQAVEDAKMANLLTPPKGLRPADREAKYALQVDGYESEADRRI